MSWVVEARRSLLQLREVDSGWGYRPSTEPAAEPTVLACLGLLATDDLGNAGATAISNSSNWLASIQNEDGSIGVTARLRQPRWPTSLAILLWQATNSQAIACEKAVTWLLARNGKTWPRRSGAAVNHDTSIPGWPWVAETHPWVEPTALAILALRRSGQGSHVRVDEGRRMLIDRMIPTGGWNYGNSIALGTVLRPRPAPSGLALVALAGLPMDDKASLTSRRYLANAAKNIRSPQSLCWSHLGLTAWARLQHGSEESASDPRHAPTLKRIEELRANAFNDLPGCSDLAVQLAYLLMTHPNGMLPLLSDPIEAKS